MVSMTQTFPVLSTPPGPLFGNDEPTPPPKPTPPLKVEDAEKEKLREAANKSVETTIELLRKINADRDKK